MLLLYVQFALFSATALVLSSWFVEIHLRNRRSWDAIAIRLQHSQDAGSPGALFRRAGVLLEAVDYVEWKSNCPDRALIESLRHDALALRLSSARAILGIERSSHRA